MSRLNVGDQVTARSEITEDGFARRGKRHMHASPGDSGTVLAASDGPWTLVVWQTSGTATDCHESEIEPFDPRRSL